MGNDDRLLSLREFSNMYGVNIWLARKMVKRGDIPSVQCGQRRRISLRSVQTWLAAAEHQQAHAQARRAESCEQNSELSVAQ